MIEGGVLATVRRVGHAVWIERRMFEALGSWVPGVAEPEAKVALATQSRHHAWRAEQLAALLSTFGGTDAERLADAPDASVGAALDGCDPASTAERLRVVDDLCGRLLEEYGSLAADATAVSDTPALRLLAIVSDDLARDRRVVEGLLREA